MLNKFKVKIIISIRVFCITSIPRYKERTRLRQSLSIRYTEIS